MNEQLNRLDTNKSNNRVQTFGLITPDEILEGNALGLTPKEYTLRTPVGDVQSVVSMGENGANLNINGKDIEIKDPALTGQFHQEIEIEVNGTPIRFFAYWMRSQPTQPIVLLPIKEEPIAA